MAGRVPAKSSNPKQWNGILMAQAPPVTKARGHYRHVRGGLDNAVTDARMRGLHDLPIVDVDCHIREPYNLFVKSLKPELRKALMAGYQDDPLDSKQSAIARGLPYALRATRPELTYPEEQSPAEIIDTFAHRMSDIGIKRSILIPDTIMRLPMDPRPARFEVEIARAYIRFMTENFADYREINFMIYAPLKDPERAAEIIDDAASEKGVVGVQLSVLTPQGAGTDEWNPIYEAAQRHGLPIVIHGDAIYAEERGWIFAPFDRLLPMHVLAFPLTLARHIVSAVFDGLPVRFPNLKFVFMEGGITYIPWLMQRMDDEYIKRKNEAPLLSKLPSEYMNEFYYTTQPLEGAHKNTLEAFFRMFDSENHLLYASDYPHWDFDAPSVIYDLSFLSSAAKRKILGENAAHVFKMT